MHKLLLILPALLFVFTIAGSCKTIKTAEKEEPQQMDTDTIPTATVVTETAASCIRNGDFAGGLIALYTALADAKQNGKKTEQDLIQKSLTSAWQCVSVTVTMPDPVAAKMPFQTPARCTVSVNGTPTQGIPLTVTLGTESVACVTSIDGTASITLPVCTRAGIYPFIATIDAVSFIKPLHPNQAVLAEASVDTTTRTIVYFKCFTVERTIPSSIAIVDFDATGKPIVADRDATASALLFALITKKNFGAIGMSQFFTELSESRYQAAAESAKAMFNGTITRLICGTTHIQSINQSADGCDVTVTAILKVYNLHTGEMLIDTTLTATAKADSEPAAIAAARRAMGETEIAEALYYGL